MPRQRKRKAKPQDKLATGETESKHFKVDLCGDSKESSVESKDEQNSEKVKIQAVVGSKSVNKLLDCISLIKPYIGAVKYGHSFFDVSCEELARKLLGKRLVRKLTSGEVVAGLIVETEAYLGGDDKAAHSYEGKRTKRNEAMYMDPGTIYVYHIYGTYTCVNISSKGEGAAVLIRGLDSTHGLDNMRTARGAKRADKGKGLKDKELSNGPSKLTQALHINKATFDQEDIVTHTSMWLEPGTDITESDIVASSRIGVDYAAEWAKKPLRFYVKGNKSVSVRDKAMEKLME